MSVWSTPATWVASQYVTASNMNVEVRQKLAWLRGATFTYLGLTSDVAKSAVTPALVGGQMVKDNFEAGYYGFDDWIRFTAEEVQNDSWSRDLGTTYSHRGVISIPSDTVGGRVGFELKDPANPAITQSYWLLSLSVLWSANTTGLRYLSFFQSPASEYIVRDNTTTSSGPGSAQSIMTLYEHDASANPLVVPAINQDAAATLTVATAKATAHRLSVT